MVAEKRARSVRRAGTEDNDDIGEWRFFACVVIVASN